MASGRQYRGLIYQNVILIKITLALKHPKSRQSEKNPKQRLGGFKHHGVKPLDNKHRAPVHIN